MSSDKAIADNYQKLTQYEHILKNPDMYIGNYNKDTNNMYIYDNELKKIIKKNIEFVPGLEQIFEEVLLNAFDQTVRENTGITCIEVHINKETNEIKISNNGSGIPIIMKEEYQIYIPELIFGSLLTSSNYNANKQKIVGGKNGMGVKLCNIFSTYFKLETIDDERHKSFEMVWTDNMLNKQKPIIKTSKKKGFTTVTFIPDFKKFGINGLTDDIISLMKRRVVDISFNSNKNISVFYNNENITIKKMEQYVKLYLIDDLEANKIIIDDTNNRWKIAVINSNNGFEHISFVNGVSTNLGGTHVNYISNILINTISEKIKELKPAIAKDKLFIFIKSFIDDPAFNSQTKETLTTPVRIFGSKYEMCEKFKKKLLSSNIVKDIKELSTFTNAKPSEKNNGKNTTKLFGIPGLEDAEEAGPNKSDKCRLFVTEGDSAKGFVMSAMSVLGRRNYGVFPLKGKPLNVRDTSADKVDKNEEIINLVKILGLKFGVKYKDLSMLRYSGLIILTDQDHAGYHIRGLILNLFHVFWPELLQLGFAYTVMTPIVKVSKRDIIIPFYNLTDYNNWKIDNNSSSWKIKYYKGLGTSLAHECKEALTNVDDKLIQYSCDKNTDKAMNLGFNKKMADERKEWLRNFDEQNIVDLKNKNLQIEDYINKELIHFSNYDNYCSIPSMIDGFKPTLRKVLYTCLKYIKTDEIKVAQLGAKVSEKTDYHHGESSIMGTIVNMAQNYVGSNNINLLLPNGQFGTRLGGKDKKLGSDSASERYIFTNLNKITKLIFKSEDNNLLNYLDSDGMMIEPDYYLPVIPMILINGSTGIGTGFSTKILPHRLEDICTYITNKLDNKQTKEILPWYRFFKGTIIKDIDNKYITKGIYTFDDSDKSIIITELPIGTSISSFKTFLESKIVDKKLPIKTNYITDIRQSNTTNDSKKKVIKSKKKENIADEYKIYFKIFIHKDYYSELSNKTDGAINTELKLCSSHSENNMHLYDINHKIKKYNNIYEILDEFYNIRLEYYQKRKDDIIKNLEYELKLLSNKIKFIRYVRDKKIIILKVSDSDIEANLIKYKFDRIDNKFDYLINMAIRSLTNENADKMEKQCKDKEVELEIIINTSIKSMWKSDIKEILIANKEYNDKEEQNYN